MNFNAFLSPFSEDKFKKIDEEFTKCNTFLVSCLGNIVKRGAFPHCKLFNIKRYSYVWLKGHFPGRFILYWP